ncbi:MAG: hypothetical protein ABIP77_02665 [Candidatus Limnocylindrales bacterium]
MPELHLKDLRFPELRMPEMTRDDIAKALGEARKELGDVRKELVEMRNDIDLSRIDVPKGMSDAAKSVGQAATSVGQTVGLVKRPRSRLPFLAGALVTMGLVGWAVRSSPSLKARIQDVVQSARDRMDAMRASDDGMSTDDMEPRAFDAAVTIPVEPSTYADDLASSNSPFDGPTDLPKGLGTNGDHGAADGTESLVDVSRS